MGCLKTGNRLSFKEFNDWWASRGNFSYLIQTCNISEAIKLERYLLGLGFNTSYNLKRANWKHGSRKFFNLRVMPKQKSFYRTVDKVKCCNKFRNVYEGNYFNNFCFKYVLIEKIKL